MGTSIKERKEELKQKIREELNKNGFSENEKKILFFIVESFNSSYLELEKLYEQIVEKK